MGKKGYLFWDDETANPQQRICQAAFIVTDSCLNPIGEPVCELIDPENEFNRHNTKIHGISADDVEGCSNFREFCGKTDLLALLADYVLVAHNAVGADLHHIKKSLAAYGIEMPEVSFIDTMPMAASSLGVGALMEACARVGIDVGCHHDALADARACMELFRKLTADAVVPEPLIWTGRKGSSAVSSRSRRAVAGLGFVNGSDQTIEEVLAELEGEGLRGSLELLDSVAGHRFVVTGRVPGYPGRSSDSGSIESILKAAGAKTSGSVSGRTEYLAIGDNAGMRKIERARELGTKVVTIGELLDLLGRSPAVDGGIQR